jgi:hypothetical protein
VQHEKTSDLERGRGEQIKVKSWNGVQVLDDTLGCSNKRFPESLSLSLSLLDFQANLSSQVDVNARFQLSFQSDPHVPLQFAPHSPSTLLLFSLFSLFSLSLVYLSCNPPTLASTNFTFLQPWFFTRATRDAAPKSLDSLVVPVSLFSLSLSLSLCLEQTNLHLDPST